MLNSINTVTILGNLGHDPEVRQFQNGSSVMSFTVATEETWKDKNTGDYKSKMEWQRVSVFSKYAIDMFQKDNVTKGEKVHIVGKLETRKWQDKDGKDTYTTEIVVKGYEHSCNFIRTVASPQKRENNYAA